jgi:hypothetical protein
MLGECQARPDCGKGSKNGREQRPRVGSVEVHSGHPEVRSIAWAGDGSTAQCDVESVC